MANDLNGKVWVVDTASATAILTKWADLRNIRWVGGSAAGHEAIVQDQNGRVVWRALAQGANQNWETEFGIAGSRFGHSVDGLIVPTLTSGTLYLTFV